MYDKVTIRGVIYYSYLHKKVLREEALPTIEHQFQPPPQASITTHTKVKELLLKKQPCNKVVKNVEQVNSQMQVQIQITSPKGEHHSNTQFPRLLEERQTDNCYMNHIKTEDSSLEQKQQLQLATIKQEHHRNTELQGLLVEQQDNIYFMNYIKTEDSFEEQIDNKFTQHDVEIQPAMIKQEHHSNTESQISLVDQQPNNYSMNDIKTEDIFEEQIDNQFTQSDVMNQLATVKQEHHSNTELQRLLVDQQTNNYSMNNIETEDIFEEQIDNQFPQSDVENQLATIKQEHHSNTELQRLLIDQQTINYPMNYIKTEDRFQKEIENQYAQNDLEDQRGRIEHQQTQQIQLAIPLLVDQQANNYSLCDVNTKDTFQNQIESQFDQSYLEKQCVGKDYLQKQELNESIECLKNKLNENSILPPYWLYIDKAKELEFMRIDPRNMRIKNHLRLNEDLSITVIFLSKEEFLTRDKVPLKYLKSYLKSVEKWPICVGTQIEGNKYSKTCQGVIIGDESYKRCRKDLRCKSCRILRIQLQNHNFQKHGPRKVC